MLEVFGKDRLGRDATTSFPSALKEGTYENYNINMRIFISFFEGFRINATSVDIAR
jgi:hypothetical protein